LPGDHSVANHHATEWASHCNFFCPSINSFIDAVEVDASTNLLFHPHAPTTATAAERTFFIARHLFNIATTCF
jgi:hypothetical protein